MIDPARVCELNSRDVKKGSYVLYWMQAGQRASCNHALEYAIEQANELGLPVVVGFGLMDDYPEANLRHYGFMLQGLSATAGELEGKGIPLVVRRGRPVDVILELSRDAAMVICDRGYTIHQRRWRDELADKAAMRVVQVESEVVVPVETASGKAEFAARTIRPKLTKLLARFMVMPKVAQAGRDGLKFRRLGAVDLRNVDDVLKSLKVDRSVLVSGRFTGGTAAGMDRLQEFIAKHLRGYADERSEPAAGIVSCMSPYLHFGQISPIQIAQAVQESTAPKKDKDAYLEELIVRRELACNYTHFTPEYWKYEAMPAWAKRTLGKHARDKRQQIYMRAELERAETTDPYWNASMREMAHTGYMHNYMRMYWGKCVIGWKETPEDAFEELLYLNNKYFIDGRNPNSYAGVGWCFGLHDRPWGEREVYGQVRYMNAAGLERKFDMKAYIAAVDEMSGAAGAIAQHKTGGTHQRQRRTAGK